MFKFYFLDDDIEHNTSFHSNTLYYDNLSTLICKLTIFVVSLSFILYKSIQGISRMIMSLTEFAISDKQHDL
jgi:hypothetical protein